MEPYLKPEIALAWSLCAKKNLDNVNGVSPDLDTALYIFNDEGLRHERLQGMMVSSVDDVVHTGICTLEDSVVDPLGEDFEVGNEDQEEFRYVGM